MTKMWTRIDIECGPDADEFLAAELAEAFGVSVEFTPEGIRIYVESAGFVDEKRRTLERILARMPVAPGGSRITPCFSEIPDEDWSQTWKAHFKPLRVGRRFVVAPTWEKVEPKPEDLVIRIDPGRAFGTGHHETTRLCLEWLEIHAGNKPLGPGSSPGSLLDVGTGSGILAIGAALLGFKKIVGVDNDPEAVEVAVPNIELNALCGKIRVVCGSARDVRGRFDVVISNIQSLPLLRMSRILAAKVKNGGRLALSGILVEQAEDVRAEYESRGMSLVGSQTAGEWILLEFEKGKGE